MTERGQPFGHVRSDNQQGFVFPLPEYERTIPTRQDKYGLSIQPFCHIKHKPYAFLMEFGDRLKQARIEKGLSQEKLGEGLGMDGSNVTKQTVYGWEHNNHAPTTRQLALICERLGHSADWFLFGKEMQDLKSLNGLEAQLVFLYRGLSEKVRDQLVQHADKLLALQPTMSAKSHEAASLPDETTEADDLAIQSYKGAQKSIFNLGSFDNSKKTPSKNVGHPVKQLRK